MKIASSDLQMSSTHVASRYRESSESLRLWAGRQDDPPPPPPPAREPVQLSAAGLAAYGEEAQAAQAVAGSADAVENDPKLQLIRAVVEILTGRKVEVFSAADLGAAGQAAGAGDSGSPPPADGGPAAAGYGLEYDRREVYGESERTTFSAAGAVRTADGREIRFRLDLAMERSYREESTASLRLGDAARKKDPLVLDFAGTAAQLSSTRFRFDLDADGESERIAFAGPGSGFLALDRNGDGRINDGRELFGPTGGDGFAELAALDGDRNGWIDENDAAYRDLRLWTKDAAGGDRLQTLAEVGVGALALARAATPFDLKDDANRLQGQVRSTGVFLREDGGAGSIRQIDLVA